MKEAQKIASNIIDKLSEMTVDSDHGLISVRCDLIAYGYQEYDVEFKNGEQVPVTKKDVLTRAKSDLTDQILNGSIVLSDTWAEDNLKKA